MGSRSSKAWRSSTTQRLLTRAVVVLSLVLGTAGCASSNEPVSEFADEIRSLANRTSVFQADLLADGELTYAEYEAAWRAFASCLDEAGFDVELRTIEEHGTFVTSYSASGSDQLDAVDDCDAEYRQEVTIAWSIITAPTESELQARRLNFQQCLEEAGHENVPLPASDEETSRIVRSFPEIGMTCAISSRAIDVVEFGPP